MSNEPFGCGRCGSILHREDVCHLNEPGTNGDPEAELAELKEWEGRAQGEIEYLTAELHERTVERDTARAEAAEAKAALVRHQTEPDENDPDGWIRRSALNHWHERYHAARAEAEKLRGEVDYYRGAGCLLWLAMAWDIHRFCKLRVAARTKDSRLADNANASQGWQAPGETPATSDSPGGPVPGEKPATSFACYRGTVGCVVEYMHGKGACSATHTEEPEPASTEVGDDPFDDFETLGPCPICPRGAKCPGEHVLEVVAPDDARQAVTDAPTTRWRKRPIVISAVQFTGEQPWPDGVVPHQYGPDEDEPPSIETLEGWMCVSPGDWIIIGVKGERYPCKPDIFAMTYEPADQPASAIVTDEASSRELVDDDTQAQRGRSRP